MGGDQGACLHIVGVGGGGGEGAAWPGVGIIVAYTVWGVGEPVVVYLSEVGGPETQLRQLHNPVQ